MDMSSETLSNFPPSSECFLMEFAQIISWFYGFLGQIDKRIRSNIHNQMTLYEAYNTFQEMFCQDEEMQLKGCENFLAKCENLKREIYKTKQNCLQLQEIRKETFTIYLKNTLTLLDLLDAEEFETMIDKFMELKACSEAQRSGSFIISKDDDLNENDEFKHGSLRKRRNSS